MKKSIASMVSCVVVMSVLFVGCMHSPVVEEEQEKKEEARPVKVGVLVPLSGPAAGYGEEAQMVLDYTASQMNGEEVVVELFYEDSKCAGKDAVTAYQKLVDITGVDVILGGFCSSETLAIEPLLEGNNMVALSAGSSNPEIEGKSQNLMTLSYNDDVIADAMTTSLEAYEKVALISEQNDYNIGIKNALEKRLGDKIVANEVFEKGATDMRNAIEKIKKATPNAIVLNPNVGTTADNLLKQFAESTADLTDVALVTQNAYLGDESRANAKDFAEGMIVFDAPTITSDDMKVFVAALSGPTENLGAFYTATVHDALENLVRAVQDSRSNNSSVLDELRNNSLSGFVANGNMFSGKNFVQGVTAGKFVVTDGKAVFQE